MFIFGGIKIMYSSISQRHINEFNIPDKFRETTNP